MCLSPFHRLPFIFQLTKFLASACFASSRLLRLLILTPQRLLNWRCTFSVILHSPNSMAHYWLITSKVFMHSLLMASMTPYFPKFTFLFLSWFLLSTSLLVYSWVFQSVTPRLSGNLLKASYESDLEWLLRYCISNKFSNNANAFISQSTLWGKSFYKITKNSEDSLRALIASHAELSL